MTLPPFDFAQAVGMLSLLLGVLCFYQKDDHKFKIVMIVMFCNQVLHFALLGATTACLISVLAVFRTWLSMRTSSGLLAFGFIIVSVIVGLFTYTTWVDMLPVLGACIGTYALFCMRGIAMRFAFLVGGLLWLTNNILVGSIGATLLEMMLVLVNLSTIARLYMANKSKPIDMG